MPGSAKTSYGCHGFAPSPVRKCPAETTQTELEKEVPPMIEKWMGLPVDDRYDTLVTVCFMLILFYGVDYAYKRFTDSLGSEKVKASIDELTDELARISDRSPDDVRRILERYISKKGRVKELAKAAVRFFRPSRNQNNDAVIVSGKRINADVVSEVPSSVDLHDLDSDDYSFPMNGVRIDIRAKDIDKDGSGWSGIVENITNRRLPLRFYPNVPKSYLWDHNLVWADVLVTYRRSGATQTPVRYHVVNVYDRYPGPDVTPLGEWSEPQSPSDTEP